MLELIEILEGELSKITVRHCGLHHERIIQGGENAQTGLPILELAPQCPQKSTKTVLNCAHNSDARYELKGVLKTMKNIGALPPEQFVFLDDALDQSANRIHEIDRRIYTELVQVMNYPDLPAEINIDELRNTADRLASYQEEVLAYTRRALAFTKARWEESGEIKYFSEQPPLFSL